MGTSTSDLNNDVNSSVKNSVNAETRVCLDDECNTRLSRYNEYSYCSLHQPMVTPRTRGRVID